MLRSAPAGTVHFANEDLTKIGAALPLGAPPERLALLPEILRAWEQEDLREHLSREGRAVLRHREKQLEDIKQHATGLLAAVEALDEAGRFEMTLRPQMWRDHTEIWNADTEAAERRRNEAVTWLNDLIDALNEPQPKPPPDRATRHYLMMADLAAIFELISSEPATRRTNFDSGVQYGPFWNFAKAVWSAVYGDKRGLQNAVRIWVDDESRRRKLMQGEIARAEEGLGRPLDGERDQTIVEAIVSRSRSHSPFVANLQFRHPSLWRKLRDTRQ